MNEQFKIVGESDVEQDLKILLNFQILGEYNSVEITEVFVKTKKDSAPINMFTLMVAENRNNDTLKLENPLFITPRKGISISSLKGWYIGIKTYLVSVNKAIEMFANAEKDNQWDSCGQIVAAPKYQHKKRIFTPPDSFERVPLNSVLKNNFNNGSYVVELINQNKDDFLMLFEKTALLQELSDGILQFLPIDLSSLSDRLGNVIFQIPVKAIQTKTNLLSDLKSIDCKVAWHPDIKPRELMVCGYQEDGDFNKNDFHIERCTKTSLTVSVPIPFNHKGAYNLTVWDSVNKLILTTLAPSSFLRTIGFSSNIAGHENRVVYHNDGSSSTIPIVTQAGNRTVGDSLNNSKDWSRIRIYENNRGELRKNRDFVQYNPKGKNKKIEHNKALKDLIFLINKYGGNGVYLWDPYLSPSDIVKTLFHSKHNDTVLKAISSLKEPPIANKSKVKGVFDRYYDEFESFPPEMLLGINLQFRSPKNNNGWNFHDRFLIFPDVNNLPMAWSLGTSVNSFGQEHHILQKCGDPRLILDAFNELWEDLEKDECLVWGTK
ncbi:hypothetical protein BH581_01220 [Vibrio splendidus]|uniref:VPA1262 family N-terminal domain-containing protein n=1 Tax=Vibrio splendidus TaxID=29497 RepID=UPI000976885F|nr:VPA1262 family N-terminal domain-containing protein [Vibrio splendidus]OMO31282.1 hypothetical protein BH581_01220 [Vibrio splendidus]